MNMTMFAVKKVRADHGFELVEDAPIPELGPTDVLIAPRFAGICGTDRHIYDWDEWGSSRVPLGITVGHEFMGEVVDVGPNVTAVRPGMRVSGEGHIGCGHCEPCRTGKGHICERVQIIGVDRDGCFARYLSLPEANVWPLVDHIDDRTAALLDPLGNAMHTVMAAGVSGRSILITGAGVIGLMAVAISRAAGAGVIMVSDIDARHLDKAVAFGADHVFAADDPEWPAQARSLTQGQGPQVLLEMSGAQSAMRDGFAALRNGGTAALLGLPHRLVEMNLASDIIFKGATVLGINGRLMYETWYQVENFLTARRLDVASLVTHEFPVRSIDDAFDVLQRGEAIKVLLRFPDVDDAVSAVSSRGAREVS